MGLHLCDHIQYIVHFMQGGRETTAPLISTSVKQGLATTKLSARTCLVPTSASVRTASQVR